MYWQASERTGGWVGMVGHQSGGDGGRTGNGNGGRIGEWAGGIFHEQKRNQRKSRLDIRLITTNVRCKLFHNCLDGELFACFRLELCLTANDRYRPPTLRKLLAFFPAIRFPVQ